MRLYPEFSFWMEIKHTVELLTKNVSIINVSHSIQNSLFSLFRKIYLLASQKQSLINMFYLLTTIGRIHTHSAHYQKQLVMSIPSVRFASINSIVIVKLIPLNNLTGRFNKLFTIIQRTHALTEYYRTNVSILKTEHTSMCFRLTLKIVLILMMRSAFNPI